MKVTTKKINYKIEQLIEELDLVQYKSALLDELRFQYKLSSFEGEDYSELGNSRFGGLPDLPINVEYPYNDKGYYNLLCQINFADFEDKLGRIPENGILYIFQGAPSEDDFKVIFTEEPYDLVKKYPPENLGNLGDEESRKSPYEGIKIYFELDHFFSGKTIWKVYNHDPDKYETLIKTNSRYQSQVPANPMEGNDDAYKYLKGFDTLVFTALCMQDGIRHDYERQIQSLLRKSEEQLQLQNSRYEYWKRRKNQLLRFDKEKEEHFKNYKNVTCLIGLESLERLEWVWWDMGHIYLYILDEDLIKSNFNNVWVKIWSS